MATLLSSMDPGFQELRWVQPHWRHHKYELKDGDQTLVRLEQRGRWQSQFYILLDEQELAVRSRGVFRARTLILHGEEEIARFDHTGADKNAVRFVNGRRFQWRRNGIWLATYSFVAPDNEVVMTFKNTHRWLRSEAVVTISPSTYKYPEMRTLLAFGWCLMLLAAQHTAAVAAGAG
jgi:hypothetical protein